MSRKVEDVLGESSSEEGEETLEEVEVPKKKGKKPQSRKEPMIPTRVPMSFYDMASQYAEQYGMNLSEAIRILTSEKDKPQSPDNLAKGVANLSSVDKRASPAGQGSSDMKDYAMQSNWSLMALQAQKSLMEAAQGGNGSSSFNLDKIIGVCYLQQQQMMNLFMMRNMMGGTPQTNGSQPATGMDQQLFGLLMNQNNQFLGALQGQMAQNTEMQKTMIESQNKEQLNNFQAAVQDLQSNFNNLRAVLDTRIANIQTKEPTQNPDMMNEIRDSFNKVEAFEKFIENMAAKRGLTKNQATDLVQAAQVMDMQMKQALMGKAIQFFDTIGTQGAHAIGQWVGSKIFSKGQQGQGQESTDYVPEPIEAMPMPTGSYRQQQTSNAHVPPPVEDIPAPSPQEAPKEKKTRMVLIPTVESKTEQPKEA